MRKVFIHNIIERDDNAEDEETMIIIYAHQQISPRLNTTITELMSTILDLITEISQNINLHSSVDECSLLC